MYKKIEQEMGRPLTESDRAFLASFEGSEGYVPGRGTTKIVVNRAVDKTDHTDSRRRERSLEELTEDRQFLVKGIENAMQNKTGLAYAILDVDWMHRFNENYGRSVGNMMLRELKELAESIFGEGNVRKPTEETPYTVGDQLILRLYIQNEPNAQQEVDDKLRELANKIKQGLAPLVYAHIKTKGLPPTPRWEGLEAEKITVSIGYIRWCNVRLDHQETEPCSLATSLEDFATNNLKVAKKKKDTVFGL